MKFFWILAMLFTCTAQAQISDDEVLRQMDRIDLGFGEKEVKLSAFYSGEGISTQPGAYLEKKREEFLCIVPVQQGERSDKVAFVVYRPSKSADWSVSKWMSMRFASIEAIDIQQDGITELLIHVSIESPKMTNEVYRITSILGDTPNVLFSIEGFSLGEEGRSNAVEGMQLSRRPELSLDDLDEDGVKELTVHVSDEYFHFEDNNENREFEPMMQMALPGFENNTKIYKWSKRTFQLIDEY